MSKGGEVQFLNVKRVVGSEEKFNLANVKEDQVLWKGARGGGFKRKVQSSKR